MAGLPFNLFVTRIRFQVNRCATYADCRLADLHTGRLYVVLPLPSLTNLTEVLVWLTGVLVWLTGVLVWLTEVARLASWSASLQVCSLQSAFVAHRK